MGFEEFKERLRRELEEFCGDGMEVSLTEVNKGCGKGYEGLQAMEKGRRAGAVIPVINLEPLYEAYRSGKMQIEECIQVACDEMEYSMAEMEAMQQFVERIADWEQARRDVYPVLFPTEGNDAYLEEMAYTRMLDLAVTYAIRMDMEDGGNGIVRITKALLAGYGVSLMELHGQAMENLKRDGYQFRRMDDILKEGLGEMPGIPKIGMYVLTNAKQVYGAVGILDKESLREFAKGKDYYILPSSVHETIFVPAGDVTDGRDLSRMVLEINQQIVKEEERLSDHSYYYDAAADEVRMCA